MESDLSDHELDALLLAQARTEWQKVALIVGKAMMQHEAWDDDRISQRMIDLVDAGKLESAGDVRKWRYSEVRLPEK